MPHDEHLNPENPGEKEKSLSIPPMNCIIIRHTTGKESYHHDMWILHMSTEHGCEQLNFSVINLLNHPVLVDNFHFLFYLILLLRLWAKRSDKIQLEWCGLNHCSFWLDCSKLSLSYYVDNVCFNFGRHLISSISQFTLTTASRMRV